MNRVEYILRVLLFLRGLGKILCQQSRYIFKCFERQILPNEIALQRQYSETPLDKQTTQFIFTRSGNSKERR
jgi:hypothetical protein